MRNRSIVTSLKLKKGVGGALDDGVQKLGETHITIDCELNIASHLKYIKKNPPDEKNRQRYQ